MKPLVPQHVMPQHGQATREAPIDPKAGGRLFAKMPDPRSSMND